VTSALTKAPIKDVGVETDEKGMFTASSTTVHIEQSQPVVSVADAETTKDAAPPPTAEKTSGSSDMGSLLMGMILSSVLGLVSFALNGIAMEDWSNSCHHVSRVHDLQHGVLLFGRGIRQFGKVVVLSRSKIWHTSPMASCRI
jgi:hypothetical protein